MYSTVRIFHHGLDAVAFEDDDATDVADGITDSVQHVLREKRRSAGWLNRMKLTVLKGQVLLDSRW